MSAIKQAAPCQLKVIRRMFELRSKHKFPLSNWYYKNTATQQLRAEALLSALVPPNSLIETLEKSEKPPSHNAHLG